MPHQCTNCERVFPDGSKEMLSGCPDCGGNKFQFKPDSAAETPTLGADDAAASASDTSPDTSSSAPDASPSASTSSSPPDSSPSPPADATPDAPDSTVAPESDDEELIEAESDPSVLDGPEDTAQADARRSVVTRDELDDASAASPPTDDAARARPPTGDDAPGIDDLREELNDQFESIKILEPGQYELNLMELYDRQECIISLQEDGHYVIEVADSWRDDGA